VKRSSTLRTSRDMIDKTIQAVLSRTPKRDYNDNIFPGVHGLRGRHEQGDARWPVPATWPRRRRFLTAAGYKLNGTQLMSPSGEPVTINFVHTDTQVRGPVGAACHAVTFRQLGIKVNDKVHRGPGRLAVPRSTSTSSSSASPDRRCCLVTTTSGTRGAGQQLHELGVTPQSDQLLDQMSQTLDPAKEAALLNQQDAIMAKAYVTLALYQKPNLQVATKPVHQHPRQQRWLVLHVQHPAVGSETLSAQVAGTSGKDRNNHIAKANTPHEAPRAHVALGGSAHVPRRRPSARHLRRNDVADAAAANG